MFDGLSIAYTILLLGALVQLANWIAPYENLSEAGCELDYVYDGDTVSIRCNGEVETARIIGLDAAETKTPSCSAEAAHGERATLRLREIVQAGVVSFAGNERDKYGRLLVTMKVDGVDVAGTLIDEGLAIAYRGGTRINWCERLGQ